MVKYHGTPIGGSRVDVARFLMGRDALVPFLRPDDLPIVMEVCRSFIIDNSAYSYWIAGHGSVDFDDYMDFVRANYRHPGFAWALIPDVIDGTEEHNASLVHLWLRCGPKFKGVPVWHLHESLEWLEWQVERFEIVAIGSSGQWATPGTFSWWQRMAEVMAVTCDVHGRPRCKLHFLRLLDTDIFPLLPAHSGDSTNAAVNCGAVARFGMYKPPTSSQRADVIASIIESRNSAAVWQRPMQQSSLQL